MKHTILIKYVCPECDCDCVKSIEDVKPSFHNVTCWNCEEHDEDDEIIRCYMEPTEIIQNIRTSFDEKIQYIPSKPSYCEQFISEIDIIQSNDDCDCCNGCIYEEEYCGSFKQCPTTCSNCTSTTHKKLEFLKENHYCYDEYWFLSGSMATFLIPRFRGLLKNHVGYPSDLKDDQEYIKILKSIIIFLRIVEKDDYQWKVQTEECYEKRKSIYKYGKAMLCKYIDNLWD